MIGSNAATSCLVTGLLVSRLLASQRRVGPLERRTFFRAVPNSDLLQSTSEPSPSNCTTPDTPRRYSFSPSESPIHASAILTIVHAHSVRVRHRRSDYPLSTRSSRDPDPPALHLPRPPPQVERPHQPHRHP